MASFTIAPLLIFALLGGQGVDMSNDFVSLLPVPEYWEHQEVEMTAEAMLAELAVLEEAEQLSAEQEVRVLMAIRTLGRLEAEGAVEQLEALIQSPHPFVSDHAKLALGQIRGEAPDLDDADRIERVNADVSLLPRDTGSIVAQSRTSFGTGVNYDALIEQFGETAEQQQFLPDEQELRRQLQQNVFPEMFNVAGSLGNMRIDSVTVGMSEEIGPDAGYAVVIVQGLWHADRFRSLMEAEADATFEQRDELYVWEGDRWNPTIIMRDNRHLAILIGPEDGRLAVDAMIATLTGEKGGPAGEQINQLLEGVDQAATVWGVMRFTPGLRREMGPGMPVMEMFEHVTIEANHRDPGVELETRFGGGQPGAAEELANQWRQAAGGMQTQLNQQAQVGQPVPDVVFDLLDNLMFEADDTTLTVTTETDEPLGGLSQMLGLMFMSRAAAPAPQQGEPAF